MYAFTVAAHQLVVGLWKLYQGMYNVAMHIRMDLLVILTLSEI